ncbi:MAG: cation:proton antiporter [Thermoleophilia bacterium]|jgi:Kef-type K+ transport system membrane component KefB
MPEFADDLFLQIAAVLAVAAVVGAIALTLRQPLVVSFIAVGILVGPAVLGIVEEEAAVAVLAEIGIAMLLFVVGLKLDLRMIRSVGPVALVAGLGQIAITGVLGLGLALALGLDMVPALYVAVALTFSSTIIIVKLLSDKREIDQLHGRIAVGVLIVQDIVVVIVIILVTAFAGGGDDGVATEVLGIIGKGAALVIGLAILMRWVLCPVMHRLAHLPELLVLAAVAWALGLAALTEELGFSVEVGAFLAGVALASTPFRDALGARLVPLRDFLLLFFFVDLGVAVELDLVIDQIWTAIILALFVLLSKPLIILGVMGVMRYRRRVSFQTGIALAQISEFSLILAALGLSLGQIDRATVGLITAVGLITISLSTYLILYVEPLYERLEARLAIFERASPRPDADERDDAPPHVIVFGLGRYGLDLAIGLRDGGQRVLGVDFDPRALEGAAGAGLSTLYGDAQDPELPESLPLAGVHTVVSTLRLHDADRALLHALRQHGFEGRVALTAQAPGERSSLDRAGADVILEPFRDAADAAVALLTDTGSGGAGDASPAAGGQDAGPSPRSRR